jgi:hypothetical protein
MVGDRVVTPSGVGHIVEIIEDTADVRMLTPNNEPSVMISACWLRDLKDGSNVLPQPRSKAWWRKANSFIGEMQAAAHELLSDS